MTAKEETRRRRGRRPVSYTHLDVYKRQEYGVKVGFSAVDLVCARCGATLRLNAATPDDIDAVCAQYTLTIPGKKEQGL